MSGLQLDGQLDMDDMVLGVLAATAVLALIGTLGLLIACSRAGSCVRGAAATGYFVGGLPAWVVTGFAVAFCLVFRAEAESLVKRYWLCLLLTEPAHLGGAAHTGWEAASAVYQSITLVASLLGASNVLLLAGLYSASRVIGVHVIAANLLNVINCGQLLVGGGLCAVAGGLHARSDGSVHADAALLVLGGGVLSMSLLGLLASGLHSRCLLRIYGAFSLLVTLKLLLFVGALYFLGVQGLADSRFLAENWHYVREIYPLNKEDFFKLLGRHWSKLMITSTILLIVQCIVLSASCALRRALLLPRKEMATASERAGLMEDDEEGDEEQRA